MKSGIMRQLSKLLFHLIHSSGVVSLAGKDAACCVAIRKLEPSPLKRKKTSSGKPPR